MMPYYSIYKSPIGLLYLIANHQSLIGIEFEQVQLSIERKHWQITPPSGEIADIFRKTTSLLDRYFAGEKIDFSVLDFIQPQGTLFQQSVWQILQQIPYGQTISYGEIAQRLNKPNAVRAVGGAVGRNPISIFIPCHRVLGKHQTLTGFGGGLPAKRYLLNLEQIEYQDQGIEFVKPKCKKWR